MTRITKNSKEALTRVKDKSTFDNDLDLVGSELLEEEASEPTGRKRNRRQRKQKRKGIEERSMLGKRD